MAFTQAKGIQESVHHHHGLWYEEQEDDMNQVVWLLNR